VESRYDRNRRAPSAAEQAALDKLYADFAAADLISGIGPVTIGEQRYDVATGDLFAVPSWAPVRVETVEGLDAFRFGDDPVYEALGLARQG
jgi:gentisate 1,2-dioxygenase